MFFGGLTIAINGFSMVFLFFYHRFQWFSMVPDHWSNDAMVSMDRRGLLGRVHEKGEVRKLDDVEEMQGDRPQRSIETIASFDQWSRTIENH